MSAYSPIRITVEIDGSDTIRETDLAKAIFKTAEELARKQVQSFERRIDGFVRERDRADRYIDSLETAMAEAGLEIPEGDWR